MAEKGEKRDPKSHRTPGQIKRQSRGYNAEPANVAKRVQRNQARAMLMKEGVVRKGDGKDVDHKRPIRSGGSNTRSNLRAIAKGPNRGWRDGV
jgi:5-methylcytosine-specific restriction endonuclease McrA